MARSFLSFTFALTAATLILFGTAATPGSAQQPASPSTAARQEQYPETQDLLRRLSIRDIPGATKIAEDMSRKYPKLPSGHVLLYGILAQNNQMNAARYELERGVRAAPSDPEPYVILGHIALQERRVAEATMDFDKAKQLLATYPNAERKGAMEQQTMSGIAQVAEFDEDWKEAESRLREYLKLAPEDLLALQRLARALFQQGKAQDAYDILKAAKKIDRANAQKPNGKEVVRTPEAIMANFYEEFEGLTQAEKTGDPEKWYKAALKMAPKDLTTLQVVGVWALERGKLAFAKEQAEAALKLEESDPKKYGGSTVGHMLCGSVALWEKKWPEAEKYFEFIILQDPNNFAARNDIALALVEQDDTNKQRRALEYAETNYRDNKNSPDALSTLGWVYFKRKEFDQAGLAFDQAVKATGGNLSPDMATYVAHILYHQDRKYQAKEILESVLKNSRTFLMRPEAEKLYEKVKDATKPAETAKPGEAIPGLAPTTPAKTP